MKRKTFNILFFARKARLTKAGEAPIVMRITVNGSNTSVTTPLKINPTLWNTDMGCAIGKSRIATEINQRLDAIKSRIMLIHRQYELDGVDFGPQTIVDTYLGKDPFANIKFSLNEVERDFLSEDELQRLCSKEFSIDRPTQIRDFFLFACYTGLAFSDLQGLRNKVLDKSIMNDVMFIENKMKLKFS